MGFLLEVLLFCLGMSDKIFDLTIFSGQLGGKGPCWSCTDRLRVLFGFPRLVGLGFPFGLDSDCVRFVGPGGG